MWENGGEEEHQGNIAKCGVFPWLFVSIYLVSLWAPSCIERQKAAPPAATKSRAMLTLGAGAALGAPRATGSVRLPPRAPPLADPPVGFDTATGARESPGLFIPRRKIPGPGPRVF